jgi:hypothetical protein
MSVAGYTTRMLDEASIRHHADDALDALKRSLIRAEATSSFERTSLS